MKFYEQLKVYGIWTGGKWLENQEKIFCVWYFNKRKRWKNKIFSFNEWLNKGSCEKGIAINPWFTLERFEKEFFMDRMLNIYVKYEVPIMPLILCKGPNK